MGKLIASLLLIVVCLVGCSITDQAVDDYNRCISNPDCHAKIMTVKNTSELVAYKTTQNVTTQTKLCDLVATIAGIIGSALAGVIYGRKLRKDK